MKNKNTENRFVLFGVQLNETMTVTDIFTKLASDDSYVNMRQCAQLFAYTCACMCIICCVDYCLCVGDDVDDVTMPMVDNGNNGDYRDFFFFFFRTRLAIRNVEVGIV